MLIAVAISANLSISSPAALITSLIIPIIWSERKVCKSLPFVSNLTGSVTRSVVVVTTLLSASKTTVLIVPG